MERKHFIKSACTMCMALGAGVSLLELASCSSTMPIFKTSVNENKITVPVSLFTTGNVQLVRPKDYDYDIALRKEKDGAYTALLLRCTHADNQLVTTGDGFTCNLHGSQFDKNGEVKQGPAEQPLKKFNTQVVNDNIVIKVN